MRRLLVGLVALSSLLGCLLAPTLYFWGHLNVESMKGLFLVVSVAWFLFAVAWSRG